MTATRGVDKRGNKRWRKREGTRIKRGRREESREGVGKTSVGARKPRVGWRNRNYLAGLSEATEEKGLVARVSCGRRLKYRKFKHRSTPPPTPCSCRATPPPLDLHFVYRFFRLSSFSHLARPSLPPPRRRKPPAIRRDFPPPVDSGPACYTRLPSSPRLLLCVSARSWIGRVTPRIFSRGSIKSDSPPPPRIDRDGSFFLSFIFSDHVESDTGEGGRERSIFGEALADRSNHESKR